MSINYELSDIDEVACTLLKQLSSNIWLFYGGMGVGKTTLIKSICKQLGVNERVSSPTFSIVNQYDGRGRAVFHFDLYRLNSTTELLDLGFEDYLQSDAFICIEWPNLSDGLLQSYESVKLFMNQDSPYRKITIK